MLPSEKGPTQACQEMYMSLPDFLVLVVFRMETSALHCKRILSDLLQRVEDFIKRKKEVVTVWLQL